MAISVAIAVEDSLSECILRRLINYSRRDITVRVRFPLKTLPGGRYNVRNITQRRGLSGYGQLKVNLPAFNKAADSDFPYMVLTDLDVHVRCPGQLLPKWLLRASPSPNLLFRVAVREVEAWLLADSANLAKHLDVDLTKMPVGVEALADPKVEIVNLARLSNSSVIRDDMLPESGSTAEVGPYFERVLLIFAREQWDIGEAAKNSRSLAKTIAAIDRFKPNAVT